MDQLNFALKGRFDLSAHGRKAHVGGHRDDRAGVPEQMPSAAATISWGQARIALTRSPVIPGEGGQALGVHFTKGVVISNTSPPEEKFAASARHRPPLTSSSNDAAPNKPVSSR